MTENEPISSAAPGTGHQPPTDAAPEPGRVFSTSEVIIAAAAVYKAPIVSSVAASALLGQETDPLRRKQLEAVRTAALVRWGIGALVGLVALVVVLVTFSSHSGGGGSGGSGCQGAPDTMDVMDIVYESDDNIHWTATYPCTGGGFTKQAVPKGDVPVP